MTFGSEFWSAITGAIVASIATGLISYILQRQAFSAEQKQREDERTENRRAIGHALMFKMIKIHSNLHNLHHHIERSLIPRSGMISELEPWQIVRALANLPDHIQFSPEEMSLALSFNEDNLFNGLLSIDAIHNSLIDIFAVHRNLRESLTSKLPATMEGSVADSALSPAEMQLLRPEMIKINLLIQDMRTRSEVDYKESMEILRNLHAAATKKLGMTYELKFRQPAGQ